MCLIVELRHPIFLGVCFPLEAVAGALAGERNRRQNAESPRLDNEEEPRLQRGVPQTQVLV